MAASTLMKFDREATGPFPHVKRLYSGGGMEEGLLMALIVMIYEHIIMKSTQNSLCKVSTKIVQDELAS